MISEVGRLSHSQIVAQIIAKMKEDDSEWSISPQYESEPRLPIDLFCSKKAGYDKESKKDIVHYHVFIVASVDDVIEHFQHLLCFCRFYLTFYVTPSPRDLKLTLAVSSNATVDDKGFYKENGFGLWKIGKEADASGKEVISITEEAEPISLRDKQIEDLKKNFSEDPTKYLGAEELAEVGPGICDQLKSTVNDKVACESVARFFDQYIRQAGDAITDYKPIRFEERLVDRKLLELNTRLQHVLYREELFCRLNKHLSHKGDDFAFCSESLNELWSDYIDTRGYPRIHEKFEALLKELFPRYRDHFLHQYQNFLLGTFIMDGLFEHGRLDRSKEGEYSRSWLLASTFHDFAYSIQEYDEWSRTFFKEMLNIPEPLGALQLKTHYVEYSFLSTIENILSNLEESFTIGEGKRTEILNGLRHFFYHQLTDVKNHAVMSSATLFKRFEDCDAMEFQNVVLPAGISIILHDDEIWQTLSGIGRRRSKEEEWIAGVREAAPLRTLAFEKHPLAVLLLLCDNIQDWGRPFRDERLNRLSGAALIRVRDIIVDDSKVQVQLYVHVRGRTKRLLDYKKDTFQKLQSLLKSEVPFIVEYWDSEKGEKTDYVFEFE